MNAPLGGEPGWPELEELVAMEDPAAVLDEVRRTAELAYPGLAGSPFLADAWDDVLRLFRGLHPGFLACNTGYHDLRHTTDVFLAMARILHGAVASGRPVSSRGFELGLVAALFHDIGYLQDSDDLEGTGSKHTWGHESRSAATLASLQLARELEPAELDLCTQAIMATKFDLSLSHLAFPSAEARFLGQALGAADLLGQMACADYLERLPLLYLEFKESSVAMFADTFDLLGKTHGFYDLVRARLDSDLAEARGLMRPHFRIRYGLDRDLYEEAIARNLGRLDRFVEELRLRRAAPAGV